HSALQPKTNAPWAAFWSMTIVVISGFLGRYLYTLVPALSSGNELEELDHQRAFERWRPRMPVAVAELDRELTEHRADAERVAKSTSTIAAMFWLLRHDLPRLFFLVPR